MRYDDKKLAEILAAEYVLGTLKGAARNRYEQLMQQRPDWLLAHNWWQGQLHLLADTAPAVAPSKKVWQTIETRLFNKTAIQSSNKWWRNLAFLSTALATSFATFLVLQTPKQAIQIEPTTVALLANDKTQAGWLISYSKNSKGEAEIRANTLASLEAKPNNAFELWLLPADKTAPISLGVLPQLGNAVVKVPAKLATIIASSGLAVTLEQVGGSPDGAPHGPIVFQGKLAQI